MALEAAIALRRGQPILLVDGLAIDWKCSHNVEFDSGRRRGRYRQFVAEGRQMVRGPWDAPPRPNLSRPPRSSLRSISPIV